MSHHVYKESPVFMAAESSLIIGLSHMTDLADHHLEDHKCFFSEPASLTIGLSHLRKNYELTYETGE